MDETDKSGLPEGLNLLLKSHENELNPEELYKSKGDIILKQGNENSDLYLLLEGSVSVEVSYEKDLSFSLAYLDSFNLLGEMTLFGDEIISASVIVQTKSAKFLRIKGSELLSSIMFDSELAIELLLIASNRSQRSSNVIGLIMHCLYAIKTDNKEFFEDMYQKLLILNPHVANSLNDLSGFYKNNLSE